MDAARTPSREVHREPGLATITSTAGAIAPFPSYGLDPLQTHATTRRASRLPRPSTTRAPARSSNALYPFSTVPTRQRSESYVDPRYHEYEADVEEEDEGPAWSE